MKQNTESTKSERLRMVVGAVLTVSGVFALLIVNAAFGYTNATVWLVGLSLLFVGIIVAKSAALINFLHDITRI